MRSRMVNGRSFLRQHGRYGRHREQKVQLGYTIQIIKMTLLVSSSLCYCQLTSLPLPIPTVRYGRCHQQSLLFKS
jgi:hypothetical protein